MTEHVLETLQNSEYGLKLVAQAICIPDVEEIPRISVEISQMMKQNKIYQQSGCELSHSEIKSGFHSNLRVEFTLTKE